MAAFSERPFCYQVGMLLLLLATAVFAAGVALPWWAQTRAQGTDVIISHSGLWLGCSSPTHGEDRCSTIKAPNWFKAVQVLQGLSLVGMLVASAYAIFTNCCLDHATFSRTLEVAAGGGGVLGIVSSVLYVAKTFHVLGKNRDASYSWAFAMDLSACVLVTFIAATLALTNTRHPHDTAGHFIVEEGSGFFYSPPYKSGWRRTAKHTQLEMEMTPVHTARMPEATPDRRSELGVLQDNHFASSQQLQLTGDGGMPSASAASLVGTAHVCHTDWVTGHKESGQASCPGHGHLGEAKLSCPPEYSPDCRPVFPSVGCSCTKRPMGPSPGLHCSATDDPKQFNGCFSSPGVCACGCPGPDSTPQPHPESRYGQQSTTEFVNEKASPLIDMNFESLPRAVASAPPLSLQSEYGDHVDFDTVQHFVHSESVEDGPKRKQ